MQRGCRRQSYAKSHPKGLLMQFQEGVHKYDTPNIPLWEYSFRATATLRKTTLLSRHVGAAGLGISG